jgi:hypothetical protein
MSFNGTEGEYYSPEEAGELTRRYRKAKINTVEGGFMGREKLQAILDQTGCMGIRVYFGMDEDKTMSMVFVGADADENDLLKNITQHVLKCPPRCSEKNVLNS